MSKTTKIITIYDTTNYGNRLQNYAVQTVLEGLGFKTETIYFSKRPKIGRLIFYIKFLIQKMTGYRLTSNKDFWKYTAPRVIQFEKFNKKYIRSKAIKKIDDIDDADTEYFVVGSDQVWNPSWYIEGNLRKEMFLLSFAPPEKRICFSPSFGIDSMPEEWLPWFKEQFSKFPVITVREEAGARIVKELTDKDAEVTIDPTLMLDKTDWDKISACPDNIDCSKKYILTYFLGERTQRINDDLQQNASKLDAEIYNLVDKQESEFLNINPSEFIYLISNAELIMTDSFHACIFSFLYSKPFLLYRRQGKDEMMSRMDTLLKNFDLERKYVDSGLPNDFLEHDYSKGYKKLEEERIKVISILKKSMKL